MALIPVSSFARALSAILPPDKRSNLEKALDSDSYQPSIEEILCAIATGETKLTASLYRRLQRRYGDPIYKVAEEYVYHNPHLATDYAMCTICRRLFEISIELDRANSNRGIVEA